MNINTINVNTPKKMFGYDIIEIVEPTDKPVMTKEVAKYIIKECSKDLLTLNFFELINILLSHAEESLMIKFRLLKKNR